ncbi:CheR family methyltransferase [Thiocystis violacea]|uniref:CheR family methyltransferase n=1 Tax=Thiocystis violacea TaxID=13725 RepID=UPI0019081F3D|nr:CheR family methyltransferase [Thiocystis violacea]MBK1721343.1 SAM-dependent methyltransferase [Thiocystis violacea]
MLNSDASLRTGASLSGHETRAEVMPLEEAEFERFRRFIHERAGISLAPHKRQMVSARLQRRLRHLGLRSFGQYLDHISEPGHDRERQHLVDLLTTNETYFYRESAHFDFLAQQVLPGYRGRPMRVWSAACASGEEVYTLAMVMAEILGAGEWSILGTDISSRVLDQARRALYPMERAKHLPKAWLGKYCLKGVRSQAGNLLIDPRLKARVRLAQHNLMQPLAQRQSFDLVFLRNVLIYFDLATKQQVIDALIGSIEPGGHLVISHVESLQGIATDLQVVSPSIFRKRPR